MVMVVCFPNVKEAAARLKQLELETSPLPVTPRNNINVNMALNNQVEVCSFGLLWTWRRFDGVAQFSVGRVAGGCG